MKLTRTALVGMVVLAVAMLLLVNSSGSAQRPQADPTLPTATGKVVAYEADKSITVEVKKRGGLVEKREFALVKDRTRIELTGTVKAIEIGTEVRIWADKENPKNAARVAAGTNSDAGAPTAVGKV